MSKSRIRLEVFIVMADGKASCFTQDVSSRELPEAIKLLSGNAYAFRFFDQSYGSSIGRYRSSRFGPKDNYSPIYNREGQLLCQKPAEAAFQQAKLKAIEDFQAAPASSLGKT